MKKVFALVLAFGLLNGGVAQAFDWFGGRLSVGGGYGYDKPKLPYVFQDQYKEARMWTVHTSYFINNDVSVKVSYADLQAKSRTSASDLHFAPLVGSVRYNLFHHLPFTPYITAGAGASFNRQETTAGPESKWTQFTAQGGLGLEFFINEYTSIGAEGLYHDFLKKNRNSYGVPSAVAMVNLYFGEGPNLRRAKADAASEKQRADLATQQAAEANQRANTATTQALSAEQQAMAAQQTQAQTEAAKAAAAKTEADRQAREMQAQTSQAQAELDAIKQMIAHKDLEDINFKTARADLLPGSHTALDKIAMTAKKYPNLKLRVEGHTDSQGDDTYNLNLSQKRADAVRNYLLSTGVSADQVVAAGFGKTRPIASNDTAEGRTQNRRVEFMFFLK